LLIAGRVVGANVPKPARAKQLRAQVHQQRHRLPRLVRIWANGG
jgi:putative transposase